MITILRKKSFKSVFLTSSILVLNIGSMNVFASDILTNQNPAQTHKIGDWDAGAAPSEGDSIILNGPHDVTLNSGANLDLNILNLNGNDARTLTIGDLSQYKFAQITANHNEVINIKYDVVGQLVIGDTQNHVGNINFNNIAGKLYIHNGNIAKVENAGNAFFIFSGTSKIPEITAKLIGVTPGANITLTGDITAGISFGKSDGARSINLDNHSIIGNVDFNTKSGTITISKAGGKIQGNLQNSVNGIVDFANDGAIEGAIDRLGILKVNEGVVATLQGDNKIFAINKTEGSGKILIAGQNDKLVGNFGNNTQGNKLAFVTIDRVSAILGNGVGVTICANNFDGEGTVTVAVNSTIQAINIHNNIVVNDGIILTLNGGTLNGGSTLKGDGTAGTVLTLGSVTFGAAAIGGNNLALLDVTDGTLNTGAGAVFTVTDTHIGGSAVVTLGRDLTSNLKFTGDGTINISNNTLIGDVNFNGQAGIVSIENGGAIVGDFIND